MPLGQHLRTDQYIHLIRVNLLAHDFPGSLVARAVPVHPQNARIWKSRLQYALHSLRAAADGEQFCVTATRAGIRQPQLIAAMMTS